MIRQARVVDIEPADVGNTGTAISAVASSATVTVELEQLSQCRRCSRGRDRSQGHNQGRNQGCGQVFVQGLRDGKLEIHCASELDVHIAQQVLVEIDEQGSGWLWSVFGAYGLPLLGMILATTVISAITRSLAVNALFAELLVIFGAVCGLCAGIQAWRKVSSRALSCAERSVCLQSARVVGVVPSSSGELR